MADKIAPGAWHEGPSRAARQPAPNGDPLGAGEPTPPSDAVRDDARHREVDRLKTRRDGAVWTAVVGFALMFGASFSSALLLGGVGMAFVGALGALYWSRRMAKVRGDPWAYDPELDGPGAPDWSKK